MSSSTFRLGELGDYELRLDSISTANVEPRIRMFVDAAINAHFDIAWPEDFSGTGQLESLSFPVPGLEYALGANSRLEFLVTGTAGGAPSGWWVDNVELIRLP